MVTEYGFEHPVQGDIWCVSREWAEGMARSLGYPLIAQERGPKRIVSIRA